jgi:hypothetical protein
MLAGGNYEVTVQLAPLWRVPMLARLTDEPFTGTWKFSSQQIKIELANGTYEGFTCDPPINVKADGTGQPLTGIGVTR